MKQVISVVLAALLAAVLCIPAFAEDVKVDRIRMSASQLRMTVGDSGTLTVRFTPSGSSDTLRWRSTDSSVVSVNDNGTVTAHKRGDALVIASTPNGLSTSCNITVRDEGQKIQVKSVEMAVPELTIRVDQTRSLWVSLLPADATQTDVGWSSSNTDVADVDVTGMVTGVAPGVATITAEAESGAKATCVITVPDRVLEGITTDVSVSQPQNGAETVAATAMRTAVRDALRTSTKGAAATAVLKDKSSVSPSVLGAAAYEAAAAGRTVLLRFNTTDSEGKVQGSLSVDAQAAGEHTGDLKTGVYVESRQAQAAAAKFRKSYGNRLVAIQCAQAGSFGVPVEISARADFAGVDKSSLRFYTYSAADNAYHGLDVSSVKIDSGGRVQFTTDTGGLIIVSVGELQK